MRVAFAQSGYPWKPTGAIRVVYEYSNQLAGKGHEVRVIHVPATQDSIVYPVQGIKNRLRRVLRATRDRLFTPNVKWQPIDGRVKLLFAPRIAAESVPDGDVIFATAWDTVSDVLSLPSSKGKKCYLIQSYDTWSGNQDKVDQTWRAPLHKVVIARWLRENGKRLGCGDIVYIPNGIDHSRFRVLTPIEARPKRVAFRFSTLSIRGAVDALAALEIARARHPDLEAVFFAATPRAASIPSWIEYHRDPAQKDLIEKIYNGSSIFLMSSWTEGFPLPPMEAMACGCALVSTDCGGVLEYATDEVSALISPPKMPQPLAWNLLRVLDDDALRTQLARSGVESLTQFSWPESGNRMERFILERVQNRTVQEIVR